VLIEIKLTLVLPTVIRSVMRFDGATHGRRCGIDAPSRRTTGVQVGRQQRALEARGVVTPVDADGASVAHAA
jgi:hypothetical protein